MVNNNSLSFYRNRLPEEHFSDREIFESMWKLFLALGEFRNVRFEQEKMKQALDVFMAARSAHYTFYIEEYRNAAALIRELGIKETRDYEQLFNDHNANIPPPVSGKERLRQLVINEFAYLQMVLTGEQLPNPIVKHLPSLISGN